ncbi:MAG TPA: hypothetical protein VEY33_07015 [Gemmatimonadota bacterium]|nr:hypothetical protein [Gemmatimonadota bacterium]
MAALLAGYPDTTIEAHPGWLWMRLRSNLQFLRSGFRPRRALETIRRSL